MRAAPNLGHEALIAFDVWLCERRQFNREGIPDWCVWALIFGGATVLLACLEVNLCVLALNGIEAPLNRLREIGEWRTWQP